MPSKTPPTKTNQTNQSPLNTYKNQPKNGVYMHFSTKKNDRNKRKQKRPKETLLCSQTIKNQGTAIM